MLDLNLFSIPSFRNGNVAAAIVSLGEFGILFALPLWFQNVLGYTAFQTGLVLVALASGSFLASGLGAAIGARRSPVFIVRVGIALEIVGVAGLGLLLRPDSTWAQLTGVVLADLARGTQWPRFWNPEHRPADRIRIRYSDPRHGPVRDLGISTERRIGEATAAR
jgi:hypothetical protein